jgi:hypothetical protein
MPSHRIIQPTPEHHTLPTECEMGIVPFEKSSIRSLSARMSVGALFNAGISPLLDPHTRDRVSYLRRFHRSSDRLATGSRHVAGRGHQRR